MVQLIQKTPLQAIKPRPARVPAAKIEIEATIPSQL